ncbi:DUF4190 domain-containing protein, partial [Streptomyces sp. ATE26]|nr:DUF4190 domain-containing protein [Streptomyces sp. ATE26]
MADQEQQGAAGGGGFDPWAPPGSKPSLEKSPQPGVPAQQTPAQEQPPGEAPQPPAAGPQQPPAPQPSVHDQATMISAPGPGFGAP